jgi:hypothetical protein
VRLLINLFGLLANLPWWGVLLVVAVVLVGGFYLFGWYVRWKFDRIVREAVLGAGAAMTEAEAVVHSVTAAAAPDEPSPYDIQEDDEQFDPDLDGQPWEADEANFYLIDATITPSDPTATWDPTALGVVPADFVPDDEIDVSDRMGGLHSAERFVNGRFEPAPEGMITGPQRLRMLFGVPKDVTAVKFSMLVTYFGHVELPPPHRGAKTLPPPVGSGATGRPAPRGKTSLPWDS